MNGNSLLNGSFRPRVTRVARGACRCRRSPPTRAVVKRYNVRARVSPLGGVASTRVGTSDSPRIVPQQSRAISDRLHAALPPGAPGEWRFARAHRMQRIPNRCSASVAVARNVDKLRDRVTTATTTTTMQEFADVSRANLIRRVVLCERRVMLPKESPRRHQSLPISSYEKQKQLSLRAMSRDISLVSTFVILFTRQRNDDTKHDLDEFAERIRSRPACRALLAIVTSR